jgi:hypothetical protein
LIGSMRVRWSRPLQREAASVAAPARCAPKPVRSLSCHFATSAHVPFTARFRGQSGPQPAAGFRLRAHDKTRQGRTTPIVASQGFCPGVGRTLRVVAPFVARFRPLTPTRRHTPAHAATPRHLGINNASDLVGTSGVVIGRCRSGRAAIVLWPLRKSATPVRAGRFDQACS